MALVNDAWKKLGGNVDAPVPWPASPKSDIPVVLPTSIGSDYRPSDEILLPEFPAARFAKYATADSATIHRLFNAPAAASSYINDTFETGFNIYAVRAASPSTYVQYEDAKRLGLIAPIDQKIAIGNVDCLVRNTEVFTGGDRSALKPEVQWCERSDNGTTVRILGVFGKLNQDPKRVALMVDTVWGTIGS